MDAKQKRIEKIEQAAANAFKNHQITLKYSSPDGEFRQYHCTEPNNSAYWFDLTVWPGTLVMTGDLGDLIVERSHNMITWCANSINSIDYFAEKVSREIETEEYDPEVALENLDDIKESLIKEYVEDTRQHDAEYEYENRNGWSIGSSNRQKEHQKQLEELQELRDLAENDELCPDEFKRAFYESSFYSGDMIDCDNYTYHFLWCREAIKWAIQRISDFVTS